LIFFLYVSGMDREISRGIAIIKGYVINPPTTTAFYLVLHLDKCPGR